MSLPYLLKHVYHNATDEVIRRGKKIFHTSGVQLLEHDPLTEQVVFRVRNDVYSNHYKVIVQHYLQHQSLNLRCNCPYNMGTVCRHEAAALFQLNDLIQSGHFDNVQLNYNQLHTTVRMRQITMHFLKLFGSKEIFQQAEPWVEDNRVNILEAKDDAVKAEVRDDKGNLFSVMLKQNEERYFDTSCSCSESAHPLCVHKVTVFLLLLNKYGGHYFSTLRNWDTQKNKLLSLYGYSLKDDLRGKFEFAYHEGKPFLRVLDPSIKKIALVSAGNTTAKPIAEPAIPVTTDKKLGIVIRHKSEYYPHTAFELIAGVPNKAGTAFEGTVEKLETNQYISPAGLDERQKILITALRKQSPDELFKSIKRDSPFGDFWDHLPNELKTTPKEELRQQVWDFYLPRYQRLLEHFSEFPYIYLLPDGKYFVTANLKKINFSKEPFRTKIVVNPWGKTGVQLSLQLLTGVEETPFKNTSYLNDGLVVINESLHTAANTDVVQIMNDFAATNGTTKIKLKDWPTYLEQTLLPLSSKTAIAFHPALQDVVTESEPELKLYLRETEKMMVFKPIFSYAGVEKQWLDYTSAITASSGKVIVHQRNEAAEQTYLTLLRHLHPAMQESRRAHAFLLPAAEAMKGNWYFNFMDILKENKVEIIGYESLKQTRINPNKPITRVNISSGIDWFDAHIDLRFGEETVNIGDVKKALAKRQTFVTLKDGSMGLLTEEWMEKYALIVKLGKAGANGALRLNKFHFSTIAGLDEVREENEWLKELALKRERLMNYDFDTHQGIALPDNIQAELRPYQQSGFQWMQFLNETGWGGILADDMGLGKTLQTLTFLQHYQNLHPRAKFLVVCPTTLIYNWENEIRKFAPDITYHIHHGPQRHQYKDIMDQSHLIITTYGTLRSDIRMLAQVAFDYVVLDESQAIKNPLSQVAKASLQLQSKNRLALSGTPLQNNTFDLFAQMNFLNPGMLGTMDFFRNEFANPIDKMQEEEAKSQLRKMINPFLLRRTKEQVAPDLPEKSEMVLFCEMGTKQRKIYDSYRNSFRSKILGEIEDRGIDRAQLSILTGLMKLRQICDSPAILKEAEPSENHSVKIDELIRELTENTGNHKALVFSQFLGMLHLIREELERLAIPYVYFDGSTTSTEREKAIRKFQEEEDCRVFLISLKAGGVGLNLTAADYVYIVDPWWNPAVEQQAIDRTHRIGQTKNIFAYRLICKDTIEEKILLLQERKLSLVKDLIADDNAFIKKLTKEDVAYLLS